MKRKLFTLITILAVLLLIGCGSKSTAANFKVSPTKEKILGNTVSEEINAFIPVVSEWYNSIDVDQLNELPIDFVTDEVNELGETVFSKMDYAYLDNDSTYADTLNPAFTIYGEICKIMMESKMNIVVSLSDNDNSVSNATMTVT